MTDKKYKYPSVLTIAGFDGSGGAGIQADMKTISALGCFATSVLTALPVQNTCGVKSIHSIPTEVVSDQIDTILEDIFPDAIKIGMVHTADLVHAIVATLKKYPKVPIVFDPVMVATSGHKLIEDSTIQTIIRELFSIADVITPNLDEAAILASMPISSVKDMYRAGEKIMSLGCQSILLKGGHLNSDRLTSLYFTNNGETHEFSFEKFNTNIAAYLAQGKLLLDAISLGQEYVHQAIFHSKDVLIGKGNGPLNHFYNPQKLIKRELGN